MRQNEDIVLEKKTKKKIPLHTVTVTMPDGSTFQYLAHNAVPKNIAMSLGKKNHSAWSREVIIKGLTDKITKLMKYTQSAKEK